MHHVDQCSNCGINVSRELGIVTPTTVQHRECADRFGVATHGQPVAIPSDQTLRHRPAAVALHPPLTVSLARVTRTAWCARPAAGSAGREGSATPGQPAALRRF